jgi:hypothetical protein
MNVALTMNVPFTLLASRGSVRVHVHDSVLGSWFGVRVRSLPQGAIVRMTREREHDLSSENMEA